MTLDEALQAAVLGDRVTHDTLGNNAYVDYHFNGFEEKQFRKHFAQHASCMFVINDDDRAANWRIEERDICANCHGFVVTDGWGKHCGCEPKPKTLSVHTQIVGRALRPVANSVGWRNPVVERDKWGRPL